jgi:tRNA1Val (adenine37-N6)-methyltransferase
MVMANSWFKFKQFTIHQDRSAMKVTTDACLFGAWVARQLALRQAQDHSMKILDIGTGTGLLSLMIAQQSNATIDAVEIDEDAAGQAKQNVDASPWKERLSVIHGNAIELSGKQYNAIISNPPFYENELQSGNKQKNTAHHSTELTLDKLIDIIDSDTIKAGGRFYILLPYKRIKEIENSRVAITHKVLVRQSTMHDFFRIMIAGIRGNSNVPVVTEEIAIKDENDQYTPAFIDLLKDYYLYL